MGESEAPRWTLASPVSDDMCEHPMLPNESVVYVSGMGQPEGLLSCWIVANGGGFAHGSADTPAGLRWQRYAIIGGMLYVKESEILRLECNKCFRKNVERARREAGAAA